MLDFFYVQCTSYRIMVEALVSACRLAELDMSQLLAWKVGRLMPGQLEEPRLNILFRCFSLSDLARPISTINQLMLFSWDPPRPIYL